MGTNYEDSKMSCLADMEKELAEWKERSENISYVATIRDIDEAISIVTKGE